jgi:hypothetical protein
MMMILAALAAAQPAAVQPAPNPAVNAQAGPKKAECCCCKDKMDDHSSHDMDRMQDHHGHASR